MAETELGHRRRAGVSQLWQRLDDWWLDIDTASGPSAAPDERRRARLEEPEQPGTEPHPWHDPGANYLYLERIAQLVTRGAPHPLVCYDISCGKGRVMCVMANRRAPPSHGAPA